MKQQSIPFPDEAYSRLRNAFLADPYNKNITGDDDDDDLQVCTRPTFDLTDGQTLLCMRTPAYSTRCGMNHMGVSELEGFLAIQPGKQK